MAAPTSTSSTITINEDTLRVLTTADFPFADADPGDVLTSVKITTLPLVGVLALSGVAVTLDQEIAVASITGGLLTYTPALNGNGLAYATIGYQVKDATLYSASYVLTINVTAVNDAPTSAGSTITINEDTPRVLTVGDFPFTDVDVGDTLAGVKFTTLPVLGTLTLSGITVALNQEVPVASITGGLLVYTPGANASGAAYATLGYQVSDGLTYSIAYVLTVNVAAVNDAPVAGNYSIVVAKNSTFIGELPTASDAEGQAITYALVTPPLVGATATVSPTGAFTYTPKADTTGGDSFTYSVSDGVANNVYTVSVSIIATVVIPVTEITTVNGYPTTVEQAQTIVQGTGVFDKLMESINAHLALQFLENRIKGPDYATVYLGTIQVALTQAIAFVLQKPLVERQATSEEAKTALIIRQTKGFDDDAKQKLLKQALDSWSVAYSVAQDANAIPDAIKVNPIDSIMKNAMDALNITNSTNPIGEIG